jgi:hypothetical protein
MNVGLPIRREFMGGLPILNLRRKREGLVDAPGLALKAA